MENGVPNTVKDLLASYLGARLKAFRGRPRSSRRLGLAPPYKLLGLAALSSLIGSCLSLYEGIALPYSLLYRPFLLTLL